MEILAIAGSLRKQSYNMQLARIAKNLVEEKYPDTTFKILDWKDVPMFNQDLEYPAPESVTRVREAVKAADGVWLFSPEYNHSIPGPMKNLIDWLSRPVSKTEKQVLVNKPLALSGISVSMTGASHAQDHYAALFSLLQVNLMHSPRLTIPHAADQALDGTTLVLDRSAPYLDRQAKAFISFIERSQHL